MDVKTYRFIVDSVKNFRGLPQDCIKSLKTDFPNLSEDTLFSIFGNEYQNRMKQNFHRKDQIKSKYWKRYLQALKNLESPGIILRMFEKADISPSLGAKLILQSYFQNMEDQNDTSKINYNSYLRNTSLIADMDLAYEVFMCVNMDNFYSPVGEAIKQSIGQQYEIKLYKELKEKQIAFRNENDLRKFGYDKTPDFKLEVPIAIDGFIVNWVESKARFASEDVHQEYNQSQYLSYWNRFGPGLVIYWFGFVKTITENDNKKYIIRDRFPDNILQLNVGRSKNKLS